MRGGSLHDWLARLVVQEALALKLMARVEVPVTLPDGRTTFFDVVVVSNDALLAIEIETTPRTVNSNLEKAARVVPELWVLAPNRAALRSIQRKAHDATRQPDLIRFLLPGDVGQALALRFSQDANGE